MFNWQRFLNQHNIEFRTEGAENVAVHCPLCGPADPSQHLAISLRGRGWRCFRNRNHRGKSPPKLIQVLIRCSWARACEIAGVDPKSSPPSEDLADIVAKNMGMVVEAKPTRLDYPQQFKSLKTALNLRMGQHYEYYLLDDRDFTWEQVMWLSNTYDLQAAFTGSWKYRIIIPIKDQWGKLVCWTGRTILPDTMPRYKTLSRSDPETPALERPTDMILGLPVLYGCDNPRTLVICEGPFDALRISAFGHKQGVYGTCLFGLQLSETQVGLLSDLADRFKRIRLLLDTDASLLGFAMTERLRALRCRAADLPAGIKDPGDLPSEAAQALISQLAA